MTSKTTAKVQEQVDEIEVIMRGIAERVMESKESIPDLFDRAGRITYMYLRACWVQKRVDVGKELRGSWFEIGHSPQTQSWNALERQCQEFVKMPVKTKLKRKVWWKSSAFCCSRSEGD